MTIAESEQNINNNLPIIADAEKYANNTNNWIKFNNNILTENNIFVIIKNIPINKMRGSPEWYEIFVNLCLSGYDKIVKYLLKKRYFPSYLSYPPYNMPKIDEIRDKIVSQIEDLLLEYDILVDQEVFWEY